MLLPKENGEKHSTNKATTAIIIRVTFLALFMTSACL